jgi:hypothetical protein
MHQITPTGLVIVWDFETGRQLNRYTSSGLDVTFGPDEHTIFTVFGSAVIQYRITDWALGQLLDWIEDNRYVREFTCEERVRYRIEPLCK